VSRDPLPEPWRSALEPKGISSKRGLATKVGISPQTAKRLIDGMGSPSAETVAAVADELFNGDRTKVWELAGLSRQDYGPWGLPPEASQLDPDQRAAVLAVVRAMLPPDVRAGVEDGNDSAVPTIGRELRAREKLQQVPSKAAKSKPRTDT
jgi:hypothetical protein